MVVGPGQMFHKLMGMSGAVQLYLLSHGKALRVASRSAKLTLLALTQHITRTLSPSEAG